VQTSHLTLPGLNTPTNGSYPGKGPSGMKIKFELKILLGVVFLLMLGGTASADGVLTYQGDATNRPRVIDFDPGGVPAGNGWYLGVNPCNCSVNSAVVRDEFQKTTGWSFTAGPYTITFPATEPATGLILGLGLAVVGLMRRRRKKPFENTVWENLG
jgi:hypothetical protein